MYGEPIKLHKHIKFDEHITLKSRTNQKQYRLTAVIAHMGGEQFGHYITCRRVLEKWYVISDSKVKESNLEYISGA
jgi:ubiquitin C-terminal hydrolase